jgi:hypothetical protein
LRAAKVISKCSGLHPEKKDIYTSKTQLVEQRDVFSVVAGAPESVSRQWKRLLAK